MTKLVHIVYVHPVENGLPNLYKVLSEQEFGTKEEAENYVIKYNTEYAGVRFGNKNPYRSASYYGCVNDETGELV
jgi:hypothetical protein